VESAKDEGPEIHNPDIIFDLFETDFLIRQRGAQLESPRSEVYRTAVAHCSYFEMRRVNQFRQHRWKNSLGT
jgi:hypothetical protein